MSDDFFKMQNVNTEQTYTYDNLVIDVNNYYHKSYHVHSDLTYEVGNKKVITGGIYGFIKSLQKFERELLKEDGHIYFLFDNPDSKYNMRQMSIDPTYKANRKKYSEPFYRGIDYLRLILMDYRDNCTIIYGTGLEADDLAPNVIKYIDKEESTLIISEDLDWARVLGYEGKHVDLYQKKSIMNKKKFNERFNFIPTENNVILYKVIRGDTADNIPVGIPNIGTKLVEKLIGDYEDIFEVIENIDIIPYLNDTWKKRIKDNKGRLRLNHQLVSFIPVSDSYLKQFTFKSKFRPKNLLLLYKSLGFDPIKLDKRIERFTIDKNQKTPYNEGEDKDSFFKVPEARRE